MNGLRILNLEEVQGELVELLMLKFGFRYEVKYTRGVEKARW